MAERLESLRSTPRRLGACLTSVFAGALLTCASLLMLSDAYVAAADARQLQPSTDGGITTDLGITKTHEVTLTAVPGLSITYTIIVTHGVGVTVTDVGVNDPFSDQFTDANWTCTPAPGATCSGSGQGLVLSDVITLPTSSQVTYTVSGQISSAIAGTLTNTAWLSLPADVTNTVPGNNQVTDTAKLTPTVDLSVHLFEAEGLTTTVSGSRITYTAIVTNGGPSRAMDAVVSDVVPSGLTGVAWNCTSTLNGHCGQNASGDVNDIVTVAVHGALNYTITGMIDPGFGGLLTNTIRVFAPQGTIDPSGHFSDTNVLHVTAHTYLPLIMRNACTLQAESNQNDSFATADPYAGPGTCYEGDFDTAGDVVSTTLTQGQTVDFLLEDKNLDPSQAGDVQVQLYSPDQQLIDYATQPPYSILNYMVPTTGTYYLYVVAATSSSSKGQTYILRIVPH